MRSSQHQSQNGKRSFEIPVKILRKWYKFFRRILTSLLGVSGRNKIFRAWKSISLVNEGFLLLKQLFLILRRRNLNWRKFLNTWIKRHVRWPHFIPETQKIVFCFQMSPPSNHRTLRISRRKIARKAIKIIYDVLFLKRVQLSPWQESRGCSSNRRIQSAALLSKQTNVYHYLN